jgi:HEAT repeat protein
MPFSNDMDSLDMALDLFQTMKRRSNDDLYEVIKEGSCEERHEAAAQLIIRGGEMTFRKAVEFCRSVDPGVRAEAAHILGELGTPERPFKTDSFPILTGLLRHDPDESVRTHAAYALGHLGDPAAISLLIETTGDASSQVRRGAAFALGCFDSPEVVDSLIALTHDADEHVRDWATFGLGTLNQLDTSEIRDTLLSRLSEDDPEIRGEAMIGLAKRKDTRVIEPMIQELEGEFHGDWVVEAAAIMADPLFYPLLLSLRERIGGSVDARFLESFDRALTACRPHDNQGK